MSLLPVESAIDGLGPRLIRNLRLQSSTQIVSLVLGVITTSVLARRLSFEGFGGFGYMFAFIYFFQMLSDFGIVTILLRDVAQQPHRTAELVRKVLGLKLALALVATAACWITAALAGLTPDVQRAISVFALILPIQAFALPSVVLRARVMMRESVAMELVNRVSGFVLMMGAVWLGYGLVGVAVALVLGELAGLVAILVVTRQFVTAWPVIDLPAWRVVLSGTLALGAMNVMVVIANRIDFLMLESMTRPAAGVPGMTEVAYYTGAYRLPDMLQRLPLLAMATLFPLMSQMAASDPRSLRKLYRWMLTRAALVAVPMVLVVWWLAPVIIRLWLGLEYMPAVPPLRWLILSAACVYVSLVANNLQIALGRVQGPLWAWLVAGPLNVVLNLWWIPRWGATGAAAATTTSYVVATVVVLVMAERQLAHVERDRGVLGVDTVGTA